MMMTALLLTQQADHKNQLRSISRKQRSEHGIPGVRSCQKSDTENPLVLEPDAMISAPSIWGPTSPTASIHDAPQASDHILTTSTPTKPSHITTPHNTSLQRINTSILLAHPSDDAFSFSSWRTCIIFIRHLPGHHISVILSHTSISL